MFYVIHNAGNPEGRHLSHKLRNLYGGAHVADVCADDESVPDNNLAGNYWTAAQALMKLCDMYADNVITSEDTLIFAWFHDPTARLINDLNTQYDVHPHMFWLTLEGTGLWTIDNQEYITVEMLANYLSISFDKIAEFERALADYTGAPYAVMTDCCTHAIELCLRYERTVQAIDHVAFTAYSYLSIPMTMHKLGINYDLLDEQWIGEYQFHGTRIWDSARRLERGMYRPGQIQCLSFGHTKPLQIGHGGAILLDDEQAYHALLRMRYDGRDLTISPWETQKTFSVGYHYKPAIEDAQKGLDLLESVNQQPIYVKYPDLRNIRILDVQN